MASHYLIATTTVGVSSVASIDFSEIPQTYTDLLLVYSARDSRSGAAGDDLYIRFNGSSTNLSSRTLYGGGTTANGFADASIAYMGYITSSGIGTVSTFSSGQIYIPNYAGTTYNKHMVGDAVNESNLTGTVQSYHAGVWSSASAITSLSIYSALSTFVQYSSASLYGIKNS